MAPFPYMAMVAILASLVSIELVQMSVFSYAGYMVEYLGVVDDKDKSGEIGSRLQYSIYIWDVCTFFPSNFSTAELLELSCYHGIRLGNESMQGQYQCRAARCFGDGLPYLLLRYAKGVDGFVRLGRFPQRVTLCAVLEAVVYRLVYHRVRMKVLVRRPSCRGRHDHVAHLGSRYLLWVRTLFSRETSYGLHKTTTSLQPGPLRQKTWKLKLHDAVRFYPMAHSTQHV